MRYALLILLNLPIVILAFLNLITKFKMNKINKRKFYQQITFWSLLYILLISSFPVYNLLNGRLAFESGELTLFDIFQTTAIIYLLYTIINQRQKLDLLETRVRYLHQELSIKLRNKD